MTVDEAIRRLSEIETKFAKDIKTLLQQQQQQIEQLKCCGNCKNSQNCVDDEYKLPCLMCIYERKYVKKNKYDKCDKWEAMK